MSYGIYIVGAATIGFVLGIACMGLGLMEWGVWWYRRCKNRELQ